MHRYLYRLFIFLIPLLCHSITYADVVMIVNVELGESIGKSDVQAIYLGRKTRWADGQAIVAVTLRAGETHDEFLQKAIGKTPRQFRTYWKRAVFTGSGIPYLILREEKDILEFVKETPNAVGYVSRELVVDGEVTVLPIK